MVERKDLGGVQQPARVEHRAHAHLLIKVDQPGSNTARTRIC